MRRIGLTLALVLVACGDDSTSSSETSETEGTTSDETTSTSTSPSTSGLPSTSSTSLPETTSTDESSSSSAESSTTMEPGPACGDGTEDPGEECDDGNLDPDDACTAMCTIPYEVEWTVSYNGPASNMDDADAVIVDGEGNIIVVGSHRTLTDGFDLWLQQYAPDGTELWNFTWEGGNALNDAATGIALHPSGDVILTGYTETLPDDDDILVMRVPFGGDTPTWWFAYDGPGSGKEDFDNGDYGNAVMVDGNGDIVVVGNERVDGQRANVWVRKHDGDGVEVWTQTYDGAQSESDTCADGVIDAAGNVYVACITEEVENLSTGWITRYDSNGTLDWTEELPWLPAGMSLDADENLLITGFVDGGTLDIIVNKYDPTFTEVWSRTINGPSAGGDFGHDLVADAEGNVYVIGTIAVADQQDDIYVHKFDVDGEDQWAHTYNNDEADLGEFAGGIAVDADGNVYAVGDETVLGQQRNAWVRKLVQL